MYKCKQAALLAEVINTNSAHQQSITEDYLLLTALVMQSTGVRICVFPNFYHTFSNQI